MQKDSTSVIIGYGSRSSCKKYVTVQTGKSHISLFRVGDGNKIVEAKDLGISIGADEEIKLLEFDRKFEYFVLIVEGKKMLEENSFPKAFHRLQQHKLMILLENYLQFISVT